MSPRSVDYLVSHKVAYVAGAYRGKSPHEQGQNIHRAELVARRLWSAGFPAICPHLNTRYFDCLCQDSVFLRGDIVILSRCDFLVVVPGHEESKGTAGEVYFAEKRGIPVYYNVEDAIAQES